VKILLLSGKFWKSLVDKKKEENQEKPTNVTKNPTKDSAVNTQPNDKLRVIVNKQNLQRSNPNPETQSCQRLTKRPQIAAPSSEENNVEENTFCSNSIVLTVNQNITGILKKKNYKRRGRRKKLQMDGKDYTVRAYVVRKDTGPCIRIIPDMVSPHRPYPIYVYLFAIAIYVLIPKMSQREAARITGQRFKIAKFSASTVCRAIKKIEQKKYELEKLFISVPDEQPCGDDADSAETALSGLDTLADENIKDAPAQDEQRAKVQADPSVSVKQRLQCVFNTPFLNEFVTKLRDKMPLPSEKNRFTDYIGRCCQKYFLLHRAFLI